MLLFLERVSPEPAQAAYAQVEKCCQERQAQKGAQDDASNGPGAQGGTGLVDSTL